VVSDEETRILAVIDNMSYGKEEGQLRDTQNRVGEMNLLANSSCR
jgi:hypothetical protein